MKTAAFLILLLVVLLFFIFRAMYSREAGSLRRYVKKNTGCDENPHRGYPVSVPSKEQIAARAAKLTQPNNQLSFKQALPPGMHQVRKLLQSNPPPRSPGFDEMRSGLQKTAYEMVGDRHDAATKANFKRGMTDFAAHDPLVKLIAKRVEQLVVDNPGQLQSKIYRDFPEFTKEQVRYGLYFADELGWIRREKKGNSYQLFPAGKVYE